MEQRQELVLKVFADISNPIVGNTRLQKLVFLVVEESADAKNCFDKFEFYPYKFGPFSKVLANDIDLLIGLGYISSSDTPKEANITLDDIDNVSANDLLSELDDDSGTCDEEDEYQKKQDTEIENERIEDEKEAVVYKITDKGLDYLRIHNLLKKDTVDIISKKYSRMSLTDLLYYVYTQYPKYTVESEIKGSVLGG